MTMYEARPTILSRLDVQRLHPLVMHAGQGPDPGLDLVDQKLASGEVVRPRHVPPNIVTMNSRVLISHTTRETYREMRLAYPSEANALTDSVSVFSQLGAALLGARVGDVVRVGSPGHERLVHIAAIVYQPEAARDWHL
jgi:regulator of nucleoside diphosphate kinase